MLLDWYDFIFRMVVNQESKVLLRSLDEETTVPVEGVVTGSLLFSDIIYITTSLYHFSNRFISYN